MKVYVIFEGKSYCDGWAVIEIFKDKSKAAINLASLNLTKDKFTEYWIEEYEVTE